MRKRLIVIIFASVLLLMSGVQILLDYLYDSGLNEAVGAVKKLNYTIFVEIEDRTLFLLQDGKCIRKYPVASGKKGWPSPIGFWKIVQKGDWGEGFGGRWMGLNVPCPAYFSGTYSHGCTNL